MGPNGMRDIEGKVAREAMSECGQRASFKAFGVRGDCYGVCAAPRDPPEILPRERSFYAVTISSAGTIG